MWEFFIKISDFFAQFHLTQDQLAKGAIVTLVLLGFLIAHLVTNFQKHLMKKMNEEQPSISGKRHLVPGALSPHALVFSLTSVEYDKRSIAYADVTAVNYYAYTVYVRGQDSTTYCIDIKSPAARIKISFTNLIISNDELGALYSGIIQDIRAKITPALTQKIINDIFTAGKTCRIGNVWLGKTGYSYKWLFFEKKEVPWPGPLFEVYLKGSKIDVKQRVDNKLKFLTSMAVDTPNMALLPELAVMCRDKAVGAKDKNN